MVPGLGEESLLCHDARRNMTDMQETAQWLGGLPVPKAVLGALFGTWAKSYVVVCLARLQQEVEWSSPSTPYEL